MAEITDRRNIGLTRDQVAAFIAAHPGDPPGTRTAILAANPTFNDDYIVGEGGEQIPLIDYIMEDLPSYT